MKANGNEVMFVSFNSARKQFSENARLFGDSKKQPEKFNFYNGLANLASGLSNLQSDIKEIKRLMRKR